MKVLSAPGTRCPREEDPQTYIPDTGDAIDVPDTMYYRRLVSDGSLILPSPAKGRGSKTKEVTTDGK